MGFGMENHLHSEHAWAMAMAAMLNIGIDTCAMLNLGSG